MRPVSREAETEFDDCILVSADPEVIGELPI